MYPLLLNTGVNKMFVIVTYDVSTKRVSKVMKIWRKYLMHIQRSVFEGMITESKMNKLKQELATAIKYDEDAICIYKLNNLKYTSKEQIGVTKINDNIIGG